MKSSEGDDKCDFILTNPAISKFDDKFCHRRKIDVFEMAKHFKDKYKPGTFSYRHYTTYLGSLSFTDARTGKITTKTPSEIKFIRRKVRGFLCKTVSFIVVSHTEEFETFCPKGFGYADSIESLEMLCEYTDSATDKARLKQKIRDFDPDRMFAYYSTFKHTYSNVSYPSNSSLK